MDFTLMDLSTVRAMIEKREISSRQLVTECLEKAEKTKAFNAFTYIDKQLALHSAEQLDQRIDKNGNAGILAGIPVGVKDNFCTDNMPTTCASQALQGNVINNDSTAVRKLKEQDAVIFGKTNMDEFAMGIRNDTSFYGKALNPLDVERTPGGSSGGSAAAVAMGSVFAALGTDTGGSVRQPASYCGVTGLKPTFGRISRHGVFPLAADLDHVGILTKSVRDSISVFESVYGKDCMDRATLANGNSYFDSDCLAVNKKLRIGVLKQSFDRVVEPAVQASIRKAVDFYTNENYVVSEVDFDLYRSVPVVYAILCCASVANDFRMFHKLIKTKDSNQNFSDYGCETKRRILYGRYVTQGNNVTEYFERAVRIRKLIVEFFDEIFSRYDIILSPTAACGATRFDEKSSCELKDEYTDIFTITSNLTGRPSISVPCGRDSNGMPLGLLLTGGYYKEQDVFNAANVFEQNIGKEYITRL